MDGNSNPGQILPERIASNLFSSGTKNLSSQKQATMAVSTILSTSGAGAISGAVKSNLFQRPRKSSGCSYQLLHCKCFWRVSRTNNYNLKLRDSASLSALGKEAEDSSFSNVSADTDDMFDDLFNRHGKVVYRRNDQKPPIAEADDDAESLSFAVEMAKVASDVKAADLKVLFVKPLVYWTRFFIIATAFSRPQVDAIGSRIRDLAEKKYGKIPTGDSKPNSWTLLDFGDVVIHIFLPQQRAFYNLDEFYGNATPIELPFENQPPPFRS